MLAYKKEASLEEKRKAHCIRGMVEVTSKKGV
jgi:hypothetical protein